MAKTGPIFQPDENPIIIPIVGQKLREINSDTVQFALTEHTPQNRHLLTVTSKLPTPRKGNPGTVKTTVHMLKDFELTSDDGTKKLVPVIIKLETSFPVGTNSNELKLSMQKFSSVTQDYEVFADLFANGLLVDVRDESL
jgi:hypothetical protein